ncbi:hypothetical protein LXA43DRAFT_1067615 [Ganoderma leucocontextum]|nr:hypothetical protein LXA43DRAFT_1067615 [Ganoderma leucocontextum]
MTATALCSDIIFSIPQYLTKRDDLLTWRKLCRNVEPQMTKRLLATRTSPITLHTVADIEAFHRMTFRGGSHKGRLAAFAGHVKLSAEYIPPTHLHLILDIFEHAQSITGLSVGDFDMTLSSFLLPGVTPESESNATTTAAHELGTPADGMREVEASLSDVLARRLLACWGQEPLPHQPARLSPVPCQWRSDAILEEERFPSVTDLSVHLGNKPTSKWHGGWRPAFPNMTHLALKVGDGDTSGGSKLGVSKALGIRRFIHI